MKKYLKWILPGLLAVAIGALIWLLDLPHWKRLDLDLIQNLPESTAVYDCYGEKTAALGATRTSSGTWAAAWSMPRRLPVGHALPPLGVRFPPGERPSRGRVHPTARARRGVTDEAPCPRARAPAPTSSI